jgi:hypothetical protein
MELCFVQVAVDMIHAIHRIDCTSLRALKRLGNSFRPTRTIPDLAEVGRLLPLEFCPTKTSLHLA